jgi:sugar phosphate isomerase/epimerase
MRLACSNISLPPFDHEWVFGELAALGLSGLEVAPSRVWRDTWEGLTAAQVDTYRRSVETAGLQVVGLHSLFFDHPGLGLFIPAERTRTLDFMVHLSALCRDLGGKTLIYGGGRRRGEMGEAEAMDELRAFLSELLPRIEGHGTKLCFEPLGPRDSDFLNTAFQCLAVAEEFRHPALGLQLDAKALVENAEVQVATFEAVKGRLDHFHANEPGLAILGSSGTVPHMELAGHLRTIGYVGWVSIEQRMFDTALSLDHVRQSAAFLRSVYGS